MKRYKSLYIKAYILKAYILYKSLYIKKRIQKTQSYRRNRRWSSF